MNKAGFRLILGLFLWASLSYGQKTIIKTPIAINKALFDKHLPPIDLIKKSKEIHKNGGIIRVKTAGKTVVLKDDGEFLEYTYVGNLAGGKVAVINILEPNDEYYYLINKTTGVIDTLLSKPIFFSDKKSFVCLEDVGTDIRQRIQIGCLDSDGISITGYIKLSKQPYVSPSYIYWYNKHTLFIATNSPSFKDTRFYKVLLR